MMNNEEFDRKMEQLTRQTRADLAELAILIAKLDRHLKEDHNSG